MAGPTSPATGDPATASWADSVAAALADSGWITLSLGNSWVAFGAPYATPAYRKLNGTVFLDGEMSSGTATTTVFTLPAGFRPLHNQIHTVASGNGNATLTLSSGGVMVVTLYNGGSNASVSLCSVRFIAEQ